MVVILLVALTASGAVAKDQQRMDGMTFGTMNRLHGPVFSSRAFFEGFEAAVPPVGWSAVVNSDQTWKQLAIEGGSVEGAFAAYIRWSETIPQDESISFAQTVDVAGGEYVLSFWMAGDRETEWADDSVETVEVDGAVVFDWDSTPGGGGHYVFEKYFVDLTAYDGQTVEIAFRYVGLDANSHYLDAVMVDDGTGYDPPPPPPPPANDLCENAIGLREQGLEVFEIDLCLANDDYSAGEFGTSCTGYSSEGRDVVYKIHLLQGEAFIVSMQGAHDASLWLATDCADPTGTCVIGSDTTIGDGYEHLPPDGDPGWVVPADGWYYLFVDGFGADSCSDVTITIDAPVANADLDWGSVKSIYR
ncbi:choice-of-anchor J domain-containing protein [bacterium]|nr:choice-of-anchor J domain-containing protein [bacterium]MBU1074389.1 choice-of-anchor J domain-containing protein [bacterium]MBU1675805.1 choice-of-anchor J domain-containing protein [bacterium]